MYIVIELNINLPKKLKLNEDQSAFNCSTCESTYTSLFNQLSDY